MKNPLIVALDLDSATEARTLVKTLGPSIDFYKVGMELYAAAGMDFVRELIGEGKQVFLDLKYYDIGETVKRATAQVAKVGVRFLTVHARLPVMRAAQEGVAGSSLTILGVTVLTSLDESDIRAMGISLSIPDLVNLRVQQSREAGIGGLVCSPLEVQSVRKLAGPHVILVTPGVRSAGADKGDQKRVATPREAIADGADYLVIGRQITRAASPAKAAADLLAELA